MHSLHFSSVQLLSRIRLFATLWTTSDQASLTVTNNHNLLRLASIEEEMLSNRLILCCLPFLLPSIFPSIRVFSNEPALHIRWPKYWTFSIIPSNEYSGLISFQFRSVAQSCLTLVTSMDSSTHASLSFTNSQSLLKLMSISSR